MRGRGRTAGVLGLLVLAAAVVAVVAVIHLGAGGSGAPSPQAHVRARAHRATPAKGRPQHRSVSALVRNARPQPSWHRYTGPVPILVYHALGPVPAAAAFPSLYVSYGDFKAEMAWLSSHGYQAVTLDEMMKAWYHGGRLPAKPIVITFDNGYPQQVRFAPHVMSKYGWPGVLNEITENHLPPSYIWPVIHQGWEVDSHSLTHPDLTTETAAGLWAEVHGSRVYLQKTFHIPVNSFCYPSSKYNATVVAAVKRAGYTNAVTEAAAYATSADPYLLPRFEIEGGVSQLAADLLDNQPTGYGT